MTAAIIVLYRPDLAILERGIQGLVGQVDTVYVTDNTDITSADLTTFLAKWGEFIRYFPLGSNRGLATAQNIAIGECMRGGYTHVLFLDQDSVPQFGMKDKLLRAERLLVDFGIRVAAVGPLFVDQKTQHLSYAIRYDWFRAKKIYVEPPGNGPVEADWLISSGTLVQSSVFKEVGVMKDDLFIDWVDAEWGLRARNRGFRSFLVPDAIMEHSIGDASVSFCGYSFNLHNIIRDYYIVRNSTYLLRPRDMGWKWVTAMVFRIPRFVLVHSWYSKDRWRSFTMMMRAIVDGARGRLGPIAD